MKTDRFLSHSRGAATFLLLAILVLPLVSSEAQEIPGSPDDTFQANFVQTGRGDATAVQIDGKVLLGGTLTLINGTACSGLVRFNTDGTVDAGFHPVLVAYGAPVTVRAITLQTDGKILIGGNFVSVNGDPRRGLARLNADGSVDTGFFTDIQFSEADVRAVVVQRDGQVLVGGYFTTIGGLARHGLARLNPDGSLESAYAPEIYEERGIPAVTVMAVQSDGKLLIAGNVGGIGGSGNSGFARLNADGSQDMSFRPFIMGLYTLNLVTISLQSDGKILVAGNVEYAGFSNVSGVARFNADGSADGSFNHDFFSQGFFGVNALAVQPDGRIVLAVRSFRDDAAARHRLVRLNADGSFDPGFDLAVQSTGNDADGESLLVPGDGRIIYGGSFASVNGTVRDGVARINTNGTLDAALDPRLELGGTPGVEAMLPQSDGKVVVAGNFNRVDGTASSGLARVNADGTLDGGFNPTLTSLAGFVKVGAVVGQSDGTVLAGGNFTSVNGVVHHGLVRFGVDGTLDAGFMPAFDLQNDEDDVANITALLVLPDGKILVGGTFDDFDGEDGHNGLVRLNADGSLDRTFDAQLDYYGFPIPINALALQPDGKILVGGEFIMASNTRREGIVRVNADGSLDEDFYPVLMTNVSNGTFDTIQSITLQPDGKIFITGNFVYVNDVERIHLARLNADGTLDEGFDTHLVTVDGVLDRINAVAVQRNGRVLVGGNFISANGRVRTGLARVFADGKLDTAYNPVLVAAGDAEVYALVLQDDGNLLVGGSFSGASGAVHGGVVRLLPGTPEVDLSVRGTGSVTEGGGKGRLLFTVTGDRSTDLTVFYKLRGTARNGVDYDMLSGSLVVPAGETKVKLKITPVDDGAHEGTRTVRVKLLASPTDDYKIGADSKGTLQILDND